jgi:hypothetical protein
MNAAQILAASYQRLMGGDAYGAEVVLAELWNAGDPKPPKAMHLLALIRRVQNRLPEAENLLHSASPLRRATARCVWRWRNCCARAATMPARLRITRPRSR